MQHNSLPLRTANLPLSECTTLRLTFFKAKNATATLPDVHPNSIPQARGTTSRRWLISSSALPFPTSSSSNLKLDVDAGNRLNAHAPHPLAPSSKSASFTTTADLARRVVLNTLDDFSNSPAGSFLDATLLCRPTLESISSTLLSIHSVFFTLNASPSSHKLRQSRYPISIAWRRDPRHSAPPPSTDLVLNRARVRLY
ncbi:hypothetical protein R3P38DRAFT_2786593 [Favolaschia claudopus]|uniref:Uncharacterized protein n=1 Tax=Favolaschia claudopus TaxID=2862362 RepID=A0AAW0AT05_9AGAR